MRSIVLDYTLADLYSQDGDASDLVAVFAYPTASCQGTATRPLSRKFVYQAPLLPSQNEAALLSRHFHNTPLKMSFVAGKMPVVFFDWKHDEKHSHHLEASEILQQLCPGQQPDLEFVQRPEDFTSSSNVKLVTLNPLDRLAHLRHIVDPEIHYVLLSKRGLAYSGLPTPRTSVIDSTIATYCGDDHIGLDTEVRRIIHAVYEWELPFIIKVPHAVGGLGTFVLHTEDQRQEALRVLRDEVFQMLNSVTPLNCHLHPCCLILQEFVPGETMGLCMFVTQQGRPIFIGCSTQVLDDRGLWSGSVMSFSRQQELEKRLSPLMKQMANFLFLKGYYGPVGADLMVDSEGNALIIDLNVRVTGSYSLGCLRSHFLSLGLLEALLHSFDARCSLRDFQKHFQNEFEEGRFVLITWTSGLADGSALAMVCIAATDSMQLRTLVGRVDTFASSHVEPGPGESAKGWGQTGRSSRPEAAGGDSGS